MSRRSRNFSNMTKDPTREVNTPTIKGPKITLFAMMIINVDEVGDFGGSQQLIRS